MLPFVQWYKMLNVVKEKATASPCWYGCRWNIRLDLRCLVEAGIPHEVPAQEPRKKFWYYNECGSIVVPNAAIATNMAGRGTDIAAFWPLGDPRSHWYSSVTESRRLDNQAVRSCGTSWDPGNLNLPPEDNSMRRFGPDRIKQVLERLNADDEDMQHNHVCWHAGCGSCSKRRRK